MRAAAALLVVLSHVLRIEHEAWVPGGAVYAPAIEIGKVGVYAFFVVSGFVMYFTSGDEFGSPGAASRFMAKRLVRIAPMYWIFTVLALVSPFMFGWRETKPIGLLLSFAFLPNLTTTSFLPVLPVGWTLSFEMLFYVVFSACLILPRPFGVALLVTIFPACSLATELLDHTSLARLHWWAAIEWWAAGPTMLFVYGVLLAMAQAPLRRFASSARSAWWGVILLISAPTAAWLAGVALSATAQRLVAIAAVTLCILSTSPVRGRFAQVLRLGDASYALYLSHAFVLGALSSCWLAWVGPRNQVLFAILAIGFSCAIASSLHVHLEAPLTRTLRRFLDGVATDGDSDPTIAGIPGDDRRNFRPLIRRRSAPRGGSRQERRT